MKKYHKYIALAALTISLAACTQDEDFIPQGDADAVKITANIGKLQTRVNYDSKGNTEFDKGDQIRVKNTLRTSKNIATYNLTDEGWNTADAFVWNGGTSKNQFQAWYPITASYDKFTLPADQSEGIEAADWMTIGTEEIAKPADGVLNLGFQHRLAKVTVTISEWNDEYQGKTMADVTVPKIYSKGATATATYGTDAETGAQIVTVTSDATLTAITPVVSDETFTAIVAPGTYSSTTTGTETVTDNFMTFTIDETSNVVVSAKAGQQLISLEAGKHYTFNLTVGKDAATISSVGVTLWSEKNVDGGVAEEYFPSIDGTNYASLSALQNAVKEKFSQEGVTSVTLDGYMTDGMHAAVISAISEAKTEGAVTNGNLMAGSVTYTVNSFIDALSTWTDGTTLTLLGDAAYNDGAIEIKDKAVILDLNGHTLNFTKEHMTACLDVAANADLTIRDSGENGQINAYNKTVMGDGIVHLEGGTMNKLVSVGTTGTFYMTGGKVFGRNHLQNLTYAVHVNPSGTAYISGGTLQGEDALNNKGTAYIFGNPTIKGEDTDENNPGSAIRNEGTLTISGNPVIIGANNGHLYATTPITLNIQPTEGTWKVYMYSSDFATNNGVFAIPGAGINLDASKFESIVEGYEVQKLDDGSLALVAITTEE